MKTAVAIALIALLFAGCGYTYYGKYITVKLPRKPMDEFKVGEIVALSFQNPKPTQDNKWIWRINLYRDGELTGEFLVRSEIVGRKRYYLKEYVGKELVTRAQFPSRPTYDGVKDRMVAIMKRL